MHMILTRKRYFLWMVLAMFACHPVPQTAIVQYQDYKISKDAPVDSSLVKFLAPYGAKMQASMGKVIGFSTQGLYRKQPESTIGNFMADAMRYEASEKFAQKIDAAFVNYGGVRSTFQKGNITVGLVFELMPFDNLVVLQALSGKVFAQFLDKTAADGGWPVSGVTMEIKDKKAIHVLVNGKALDSAATYIVANSDYVANGGSDCFMLRSIAQINKGYLLRDALLEYIQWMTATGKPIDAKIENRVVNVN